MATPANLHHALGHDQGGFVREDSGDTLSAREVGDMLNYNLATSYMRGATEVEINDVFDRINTYGHRLSDQERRQAGVQNEFSNLVREVACTLRGDESADVLALRKMPSISIDLPMTKHGYEVQADDVFWVKHGILRATDLRDSMDEQCIADIAACIISGRLIDRSKDALDALYTEGSPDEIALTNSLTVYGSEKFADEFKYCVDEILKVCEFGQPVKLRELIFKNSQTNAFPSVYAIIMIAFHELIVGEGMVVSDYAGVKTAMHDIAERIERGRKATSPDERRKNIDSVKGMIRSCFVEAKVKPKIYSNHSTSDIDSAIRRSEVELADYELKQGLLTLSNSRTVDENVIDKVLKTICGMANNGPGKVGRILIGVTDKDADANRVEQLDQITPRPVGKRKIVGVEREAKFLGLAMEQYLAKWKDAIKNSSLSLAVKDSVMSNVDFNSYFGLGVIVLTVPEQKELCYYGGQVYWRNGDSTELAESPERIVNIAKRF